jgi:hypothetical protein
MKDCEGMDLDMPVRIGFCVLGNTGDTGGGLVAEAVYMRDGEGATGTGSLS